jgi:hypothetical protein
MREPTTYCEIDTYLLGSPSRGSYSGPPHCSQKPARLLLQRDAAYVPLMKSVPWGRFVGLCRSRKDQGAVGRQTVKYGGKERAVRETAVQPDRS